MREIVFDTETTGLNPIGGDRMVEIGCVEMLNRVETGRHYHAYFYPERDVPFEAEMVHGLSNAFLSDKPLFAEKAEELLDFIEDSPLVAHNAGFDFGFLNHELERCGRQTVPMGRMVDTLSLARSKHPGAKHSLDALCMRFGIDRSHRVKHGALLDAQLLAQVYVELPAAARSGSAWLPRRAASPSPTLLAWLPPGSPARPGRTRRWRRNSNVTGRLLPSSSTRSGNGSHRNCSRPG